LQRRAHYVLLPLLLLLLLPLLLLLLLLVLLLPLLLLPLLLLLLLPLLLLLLLLLPQEQAALMMPKGPPFNSATMVPLSMHKQLVAQVHSGCTTQRMTARMIQRASAPRRRRQAVEWLQ
jgi:hypothetical protein